MFAQPRYRILIVDDNAHNVFTLRQLLQSQLDAEIIEASSGVEALEKISQRQDIDLIVLDIQMPGMNGFEVAELIRQRKKYQDIPIIFLTAVYKSEKFKSQGLAGGAIDYLTKPIDDDSLVNRIRAYLRVLEKEREHNRQLQALNARLQEEIEERKRAQDALVLAKEQAESATQSKSAFLANMSHELRTPLNGILGYAQLLGRDPALTDLQKKGMKIIQQSGKHLLNLLTDILDLSKLDSGKLEFNPTHFCLHDALQDLIEYTRFQAEQKHLSFLYKNAAELPRTLYGDETRLRQILMNLLGNAIKFTKEGRVTLQVTTVTVPGGKEHSASHMLQFSIEDTGIGIPEEYLKNLFVPFGHKQAAISYSEGAGLGLALSQRLLQQMDSELQISSTVGQGSRFCFTLKLTEGSIDTFEPHRETAEPAPSALPLHLSPEETHGPPLPKEELRELYTLAIIGDILAIRKKIDDIGASGTADPLFLNTLRTLGDHLNILEIQRCLKQHLETMDLT